MTAVSVPAATHLLDRVATSLRQTPVAVGYAIALLISNILLALLPAADGFAIAHAASTNIKHLALDPLVVLPASAFVPSGNGWIWVPLSVLLLGGLERALGARRALLVAFGGHVIATLLSESFLAAQIAWHTAPRSAINILDVGPSYVMFAALAGCLVVGSQRLRCAAVLAAAMLLPSSLQGISHFGMSAIGHLLSLAFGALLTVALSRYSHRPPSRGWHRRGAWPFALSATRPALARQ